MVRQKKFLRVMKEFNINAKFYNPDSFDDLKNFKKTKIILVENQEVIHLNFKIYQKLRHLLKKKNFYFVR